MYSALRVDEYVFDTWALQTAYGEITPAVSDTDSEYSEEALRTLLELFCDWGPVRSDSVNAPVTAGLDALTDEEKRDLYQRFCSRLARTLEEQYGHEANEADIRRLLETIATGSADEDTAEFLLNYLWNYAQRLHDFDPETDGTETAQPLLNAVRNLPDEYRRAKRREYDGTTKVNGVRYRILEALHDDGEIPIDRLERIKREENERFETNIFQNWRNYTILGQLYFDFFKPRIDAYLDRLSDYLERELDLGDVALERHTVHFTEPQNYLSDFAWIALYPGEQGDQRDEYQLYLGIHWNRLSYGLHVGDNLRDDGWKSERDLDQIQDTDRASISTVLEKFRSVTPDFLRLNDLTETGSSPVKPDRADEIRRQLEREQQIVFYGPPGTGKTYVAKRFADWWVRERTDGEPLDEQIQTVTFHPSFAYEDFIEGLTATVNDGDVAYRVEDGVFKRVAETAREAYTQARRDGTTPPPYVLIVDEINRGELAQIFGETITQLEADKRLDQDNETAVRLAHSDESFVVPPNLYLIGTMNTADRSIALVDAALRRRFRFLAFPPAFETVEDEYDLPSDPVADGDEFEALLGLSIAALRTMNRRIVDSPDLGKGKQIGHARLFGLEGVQDLRDAWRYDIFPLLEEYYFGQFERIRREQFDGGGAALFDWERERIRDFTATELARALGELVGEDVDRTFSTGTAETSTSSDASAKRQKWNEERFFDALADEFSDEVLEVYEEIYEFATAEADEVGWGTGKRVGSMQAYWDEYNDSDRLVFEARTDGNVQFRFWSADEAALPAFERFAENVEPLVDERPDPTYLPSDDFNRLQIPARRLTDPDAMERFQTTVLKFVKEYEAALE